jgi:hypothetical protein
MVGIGHAIKPSYFQYTIQNALWLPWNMSVMLLSCADIPSTNQITMSKNV